MRLDGKTAIVTGQCVRVWCRDRAEIPGRRGPRDDCRYQRRRGAVTWQTNWARNAFAHQVDVANGASVQAMAEAALLTGSGISIFW